MEAERQTDKGGGLRGEHLHAFAARFLFGLYIKKSFALATLCAGVRIIASAENRGRGIQWRGSAEFRENKVSGMDLE